MPTAQALEVARKSMVDLVEVAPTAAPPVCRIIDYGKFRYEQTKKEKVARRSQKVSELREIRLRPKIGDHDLEFKVRAIKNFLIDGDKVRVTVMFRGREISHADLGWKLLQKVIQTLEGVAVLERPALIEGRRMHIILAPGVPQKSKPKEAQDAKIKDA
jgi:translation initiation factor IF-3